MKEYFIERILKIKEERKAIFLVHNYQLPEVQDLADYVGDSLGLSEKARDTDAEVIVFCGVHFMAETAALLNPEKTVLLPDLEAGCPMADMINAFQLREFKTKYPGLPVVAYVNTTAEVKAECDITCTSANAEAVLRALPEEELIFIPDKFLAQNISQRAGKKVVFWNGYCPTHARILPEEVERARKEHPRAEVLVHPECSPLVVERADQVLSTGGMIQWVKKSREQEFIIGTEVGILYRLRKENPDKFFYPVSERAICPNMKKITLEKVYRALKEMRNVVHVEPGVAVKARQAIERMFKIKKALP